MKSKLLPLLIAGLTVSAAHADNIPTVYGKLDVTLNNYDFQRPGSKLSLTPATDPTTAQKNWQLESNASRIGVKGDYPVAGDTKVIYKLEYEAYPDSDKSNNGSPFKQRNTYAGLQGSSWGTIFAGKNDTPLKAIAAETVQVFKDLPLADFKYFLVGEDRENNIIQYTTPNFSGFGVSAQIEPGEDSGVKNHPTHTNHGIVDRYSLAATYKLDTLYLALADDHNVVNSNIVRAVGQYGIGPVTLGALWQKADRNFKDTTTVSNATTGLYLADPSSLPTTGSSSDSTKNSNGNPITDFVGAADPAKGYKSQDGYVLSAAWKIEDFTVKGQYGHSTSKFDSATNLNDTKAKNYVVGVDYKLNDNSKVFAYYATLKVDGDHSKVDGTLDDKTFAVGYDFKF